EAGTLLNTGNTQLVSVDMVRNRPCKAPEVFMQKMEPYFAEYEMKKLHNRVLEFKPYDNVVEWSKEATVPGLGELPLYTVATFFFQEITRESILNKASSLSYNFMLAIFPGIIFLFTLIPYIPVDNFQEKLLSFLEIVIPTDAFTAIQTTLED